MKRTPRPQTLGCVAGTSTAASILLLVLSLSATTGFQISTVLPPRVVQSSWGASVTTPLLPLAQSPQLLPARPIVYHRGMIPLFSTVPPPKSSDDERENEVESRSVPSSSSSRTTFDQAGKSLMDEQDNKRLEAMGDFDANPDSSTSQMNQMRETIRARTAAMGLEKSKVSADYVLQRQQQAMGNVAAADDSQEQSEQQQQQPQPSGDNDNNSPSNLPRLDLSQISTFKPASQQRASALWGSDEEELPSMFYDPEDELTEAQRAEIDPMIEKGMIEQALHELKSTKWPDPFSALREVGLMIVVVAVTGALIIGWDKVLRGVYTDGLHFIPSQQDLANYLQRFDGLDLPSGWTDNMNDADISAFTDNVSSNAKAINSNIGTSSSVVPPE